MKNYLCLFICALTLTFSYGQTITDGLTFDGVDDYATAPHNSALDLASGEFTMEAWIKIGLSAVQFPAILSNRTPASTVGFIFALKTLNGTPWMQIQGMNYFPDAGPNVLDNQCHHIAIVRRKFGATDSIFIHVDGIAVVSKVINLNFSISSLGGLVIGNDMRFSSNHKFTGDIKEVRVWNIALSSATIATNMNTQLPPATTGLVAYYRLNEGVGQVINDYSSTANNGTLGDSLTTQPIDPTWTTTCPVNSAVGINENNGDVEIHVFPNPVNDHLTIDTELEIENITITDVSGRVIKTITSSINMIDVGGLPVGVYFLKLETEKGPLTKKFIKQ